MVFQNPQNGRLSETLTETRKFGVKNSELDTFEII